MADSTQSNELEQLQSQLCETDYIMERGSEQLILKFIAAGGLPQQVIQFLSENYVGYPQMINLLQNWLRITGMDEEQVHTILVDRLKQIVKASFDPEKADSIFTQSQGPPLWLEEMVKDKEWRTLLYELSEDHKQCLMLSFAIQRIAEAGHHDEIGCLSTASTYFKVFTGVIEASLIKIIQNKPENKKDGETNSSQFLKLCALTTNTYVYAQMLLTKLLDTKHAQIAKRLLQDLENFVSSQIPANQKLALKIHLLLSSPPFSLSNALESILGSRTTNPGDILKLYDLYSGAKPPSVTFIRDPVLIELLTKDLFSSTSTIQKAYTRKYSFVLAYACVVKEDPVFGEEEQNQKQLLTDTHKAIETTSALCQQQKLRTVKDFVELGKEFDNNIQYSVVCMGVITFARSFLSDPAFYNSSSASVSKSIFFYLLRKICTIHPSQRYHVFQLFVLCFELNPSVDALSALEIKRTVVQNIVHLLCLGFVLPVLEKVQKWCTVVDQSLIRLFIFTVLETVEPPYSEVFAREFSKIISNPSTIEAIGRRHPALKAFVVNCKNQGFNWEELPQVDDTMEIVESALPAAVN